MKAEESVVCPLLPAAPLTDAQRARLAELQSQQAQLTRLMGLLERFNGDTFVKQETGGVRTGVGAFIAGATTAGTGWGGMGSVAYVSLSDAQVGLLNQSYASLKESVYGGLVMETRLKPYLGAANESVWDRVA